MARRSIDPGESSRTLAALRRRLREDGIRPDGRLPGETALGRRLGASRQAVRRALDVLEAEGRSFATQTDTETIVHLTQSHLDRGLAPADAAAATLSRLRGAFALAFLFEADDDLIVAARHGPPLAIGHGSGEMFVGSDALALAPLTNRVTYLEDGDWAVVTRQGAVIHDESGAPVERAVHTVNIENVLVDKGGHKHFMAKEIHEQPTVSAYALSHYVDAVNPRVVSPA